METSVSSTSSASLDLRGVGLVGGARYQKLTLCTNQRRPISIRCQSPALRLLIRFLAQARAKPH